MKRINFCILSLIIGLCLSVQIVSAQTTAFNYQGSLKSGGNPANGNFDFEFALFDAASGGTQVGSTISANGVAVSNGIFSVSLNFGSLFPGTNRFLEIRVRQTGIGAFTVLTPRQSVNSSPYSIKSLLSETTNNALSLGGIAANQYITTTSGGTNFIQNSTSQQTGNFNIGGTGSANIINVATQYNIGGDRILSSPPDNLFVGRNTGQANTIGGSNVFVGLNSGFSNTTGNGNAFFGVSAGQANTIGQGNSFFGTGAGSFNTTGGDNSFFGGATGFFNTSGVQNAFFGSSAGYNNTTGNSNVFFGNATGINNTTGYGNAFVGASSGRGNTTGTLNTMVGNFANVSVNNLVNATAIGATSQVSQSNSLVLGSINGINSCLPEIGCDSVNVGIGTTAPQQTLHVNGSEVLSTGSQSGFKFRSRGSTSANDDWVWYSNLNIARLFKAGTGDLLTIQPTGEFAVNVLGSAGTVGLCRNASNQISTCSSSLRYKTNINPFGSGLDLISRLRPVTFNWLANNQFDFGLVAEEVAEIEPLLVNYNDKGEVEGVKYDRLGVVLINAVGEQQKQIEAQNETIRRQQTELDSMQKFLCSQYPSAEFCQSK